MVDREFTILGVFQDEISEKLEGVRRLLGRIEESLRRIDNSDPFRKISTGAADLADRIRVANDAVRDFGTDRLRDGLNEVDDTTRRAGEAIGRIANQFDNSRVASVEFGRALDRGNEGIRRSGTNSTNAVQRVRRFTDQVRQLTRALDQAGRSSVGDNFLRQGGRQLRLPDTVNNTDLISQIRSGDIARAQAIGGVDTRRLSAVGDQVRGLSRDFAEAEVGAQALVNTLNQLSTDVVNRIARVARAIRAIGVAARRSLDNVGQLVTALNTLSNGRFTGFLRGLRLVRRETGDVSDEADGLPRRFRRAGREGESAFGRVRTVLRSIRSSISNLSTQFVALVGAFAAFLVISRSTEEARELAEAQAALQTATNNSSVTFDRATAAVDRFAGRVAFSRAEITAAAAQIVRLGESSAGLQRDLQAALDIAAVSPSRTLQDVARDIPRLRGWAAW